MDFFEVQWPVKYKMKFGHYLNQRVFYTEEVIESKKKEDVKL